MAQIRGPGQIVEVWCLHPLRVLWCWALRPLGNLTTDGLEIEYFDGSQEELLNAARTVDAILVRRGLVLDAAVIAAARRLRYVLRAGTNTANIDLEAAGRRGIVVSASPMHIDVSVAEHAIMMMLGLARGIVQAHRDVAGGHYQELGLSPSRTTETAVVTNWMKYREISTLYGRSLGLLGLGEIGSAVAVRARAFGMDVAYHRRTRLADDAERALGVRYALLADLIGESDVVSLHIPDSPETARIVDAGFLQSMRSSAFLINVSRGRLVDEAALADALREGWIAGAGLDVFDQEPVPVDSPLISAPNVILSPHIASGTEQALDLQHLLGNLDLVAQGQAPHDLVPVGGYGRAE